MITLKLTISEKISNNNKAKQKQQQQQQKNTKTKKKPNPPKKKPPKNNNKQTRNVFRGYGYLQFSIFVTTSLEWQTDRQWQFKMTNFLKMGRGHKNTKTREISIKKWGMGYLKQFICKRAVITVAVLLGWFCTVFT